MRFTLPRLSGSGIQGLKSSFAQTYQPACGGRWIPVKDLADSGLRPIALMIEDFDDDGNLKSSSPIIFLAEIWTPTVDNMAVSTGLGFANDRS